MNYQINSKLTGLLVVIFFVPGLVPEQAVAGCADEPAAGVNWAGCD